MTGVPRPVGLAARVPSIVGALSFLLYLSGIGSFGLVGPDEPRYASIGRAMALSGDWITPRLWGNPWFEKPALLYWLIGLSFRLGASPDLAPRLPVALLSVTFLVFFYLTLRRQFGAFSATAATALLATSAVWIGYSHAAVTDIPLAVTYAAAVLLMLPFLLQGAAQSPERSQGRPIAASVLLACSVLAKGLVPLVLALPFLWFCRKSWRLWLRPAPVLAFLFVALPWYVACAFRNPGFLNVFIWQHQFGRFTSDALQHVQPFWFYLPVFIAGLFPSFLFLGFAFQKRLYTDPRLRCLLFTFLFGFVFFSASRNKLPGYLLPLLPFVCVLTAAGIDSARATRARPLALVTAISCLLTPLFFIAGGLLPRALGDGLRHAFPVDLTTAGRVGACIPVAMVAATATLFLTRDRALILWFALCSLGWFYVESAALPWVDRTGSARSLWRELPEPKRSFCVGAISRSWRYGLNYYAVTPLPDCPPDRETRAILPGPNSAGKPLFIP